MPWDYALLQLMQEVYHCPPTVLAEQPADRVHLDMWMLGVVAQHTPKPKGGKSGG